MRDFDYKAEFEKRKNSTNEKDVESILRKAEDINKKSRKGPLAKLYDDIGCMFEMVKAYCKGDYREVPWSTIASVVAALAYVVSPVDLIPDPIPFVGLIDDAAIVAIVLNLIRYDLDKFRQYQDRGPLLRES